MRICFCDDEKSFHTVVENMIQKWSKEKGVLCEVFHYDSAEQMLFENEQNFSFDLILLARWERWTVWNWQEKSGSGTAM